MAKVIAALIATLLFAVGFSSAHADESEKLDFASALEETLGHFYALEQNLDDDNAELAIVHATHPIAELYDLMKPNLQSHDSGLDERMQQTLMELRSNTVDVTREDAQNAIDDAKALVEEARSFVVGKELSDDPYFRLALMKTLLDTSAAEYEEAVSGGVIQEMAEFQDGSAFVWRSQQILDGIRDDIQKSEADEMDGLYEDLWAAYDMRDDPSHVSALVNALIDTIGKITGEEQTDKGPQVYFENIRHILDEVKEKYADGMNDEALSLATKAYLDNYEFLESPISAHDDDLMTEIEIMMREELRNMIKGGTTSSAVNMQIDSILERLDDAEELVLGPAHEDDHNEAEHAYDDLSPLQQVEAGVEPEDVACDTGMELVFKSATGSPACVKPATAERLVQIGWATRQ